MRKIIFFITLLLPLAGSAHVNSPDVYFDGHAGPYHLLVTIKPPKVIPGIAEIQIRTTENNVEQIKILPLRMLGEAAKLAPTADVASRSSYDPQLFTGRLWIMARGSWKIQVQAEGKQGSGQMEVPLPAISTNSARMQKTLGALLGVLGLALVLGLVGIVGAAARDAELEAGKAPDDKKTRRGRVRMAITAVLLVSVVVFGDRWWGAEASANARLNYKVPHVQSELMPGNVLRLLLENPNASAKNRFGIVQPDRLVLNDLIPDHGHIMHLFLVSTPDMKSFWHLHPHLIGDGELEVNLPAMPAGRYRIYADIVHRSGFPETQVGEINLPALTGAAPAGDNAGEPDVAAADQVSQFQVSQFPDGYRMVWERGKAPIKAGETQWFRFRVEDKNGKPVRDMENYMGMAGHAAFISTDGKVFAHVHPTGSASMAAVSIAQGAGAMNGMGGMAGMEHGPIAPEVSFPYGFPKPGDYRIFIQVKRGGHVETGAFVARVKP